jgi:hypothetical protein
MTEIERFRNWMDATGHTVKSLAVDLGMSYDGAYQVLNVREYLNNGFKFRFIKRFGVEAAEEAFGLTLPTSDASSDASSTVAEEAEPVTK